MVWAGEIFCGRGGVMVMKRVVAVMVTTLFSCSLFATSANECKLRSQCKRLGFEAAQAKMLCKKIKKYLQDVFAGNNVTFQYAVNSIVRVMEIESIGLLSNKGKKIVRREARRFFNSLCYEYRCSLSLLLEKQWSACLREIVNFVFGLLAQKLEECDRFSFDYVNTFLQEAFLEQLATTKGSFFKYEIAPDEENDSKSDLEREVNYFSALSIK